MIRTKIITLEAYKTVLVKKLIKDTFLESRHRLLSCENREQYEKISNLIYSLIYSLTKEIMKVSAKDAILENDRYVAFS